MLCVQLKGYTRACGAVTGGLSDFAIFDPNDLNFTQVAPVSGVAQPYSAIAERAGAGVTPSVYIVNFQVDEGEWTVKQSKKGCSTKYEHEFILQLTENSQLLTTFLQSIDAAGCCCGVGVIIRLNSGKIFIAGEKYVNGNAIPRFTIAQDGSDGSTGKLFDDYNGWNLHLKGGYSRNLYEFSGAWAVIEMLADITGS